MKKLFFLVLALVSLHPVYAMKKKTDKTTEEVYRYLFAEKNGVYELKNQGLKDLLSNIGKYILAQPEYAKKDVYYLYK